VQSLAKANASASAIDEDDVEFSILRNKLLAEVSVAYSTDLSSIHEICLKL
jgi:hypothetical protein